GSMRPITALPVIDLPAPDSPTTPSTSPCAMSSETSSTATSTPFRVGKTTRKLRTERTGVLMDTSSASPQLRVQGIAQPIAEQIDRQHQCSKGDARKYDDPILSRHEEVVADADQRAERRLGRRQSDAKERQRRLGKNRQRQIDRGDDEHGAHDVRQHLVEHDVEGAEPDQPGGLYVLLVALDEGDAAHGACVLDPD